MNVKNLFGSTIRNDKTCCSVLQNIALNIHLLNVSSSSRLQYSIALNEMLNELLDSKIQLYHVVSKLVE